MAISNVPMPSFTLVLTSGHGSHHRHPTTIRFDKLSSAPDRLMMTIDLRDDNLGHCTDFSTTSISQENVDLPVIIKAGFSSSGSIAKEAGHSIKAKMLLLFQKLGKLSLLKKIPSSTS